MCYDLEYQDNKLSRYLKGKFDIIVILSGFVGQIGKQINKLFATNKIVDTSNKYLYIKSSYILELTQLVSPPIPICETNL